jgi:hypothetical protein
MHAALLLRKHRTQARRDREQANGNMDSQQCEEKRRA